MVLVLETELEPSCERARPEETSETLLDPLRLCTSSLARWHELGLEHEHDDESELGFSLGGIGPVSPPQHRILRPPLILMRIVAIEVQPPRLFPSPRALDDQVRDEREVA